MTLPDAARAWVQDVVGSAVVTATRLTGGVASRMLLLGTARGQEVVLRQLVDDPWRRHAVQLLTRERDVQEQLDGTAVPVPRPLGLDADGARTGDPSLLMTRVPGAIDLCDAGPSRLHGLAGLLVHVHRVRPSAGRWPREYQSWAGEAKRTVPPWAGDDAAYEEAFARLREPAPAYEPTFLHRDFHPGNVLWQDGRVSGLVDWVETSTGPADLDVAHCMSHLAGLHGVDAALAFRRAYVDQGGLLDRDADAARYWQLLDLVAFLPDPSGREGGAARVTAEQTWAAHGRGDLTVEVTRRRRDELMRAVLAC